MHFSFQRIYARGETTKGGLSYGLKTDGDVERLESGMERRRWHMAPTLGQTLSPGERMQAWNPVIHMSGLYISMNNALKIGICHSLLSETLVNSHVEVHAFHPGH